MLRRLFFLFPDTEHAQRVVDELGARGIALRRMHAISKGIDLGYVTRSDQEAEK